MAYDSVDEIPDKIRFLLEHPEKLQQIRQEGALRARELFGSTKIWNRILDFARESAMKN